MCILFVNLLELFSEELTEEMQYMIGNLTDCETNPAGYKLCSPYTCVTMNTPCRKLFWLFYFIIKNSMKEKL